MLSELWPGGPHFAERRGVFPLGTDSVLLAHFASSSPVKKKKRAADLGCGSGIISILLAWGDPELLVDGVELNPDAARLAAENSRHSGLEKRISVIEGDIRRFREFLRAGAYDITVANPPYYAAGSGKRPVNPELADARSEETCTLDDICRAAGHITRWGGSFMLVQKPERLADVFRTLNAGGFEPKRIRFVQYNSESPPNLVLVESRKGGKPSLKIEAPLLLTNDDGGDSDEVMAIYRRK